MKKLILLLASLAFLTACTTDESAYKSTVAPMARDEIVAIANGSELAPEPDEVIVDDPVARPDEPVGREVDVEPVEVVPVELPAQINLDVPFYPQAPDADWGMPWQEACEEASLILAYYYATDQPLSKEKFKEEIWGLVRWQEAEYNDYIHTSTAQNAEMLKGYFGYTDFEILDNPTEEDLKKALAAGHSIVAPFAGRLLENPFFSGAGPYYHVIVIKGYDGKNFITNDVGTRRGHNFIYSYENIMSSIHDYDPDKDINEGLKKVIILK